MHREHVKLPDRLAMQSSANETNRLLCMMASAAMGYHIEEIFQVTPSSLKNRHHVYIRKTPISMFSPPFPDS